MDRRHRNAENMWRAGCLAVGLYIILVVGSLYLVANLLLG